MSLCASRDLHVFRVGATAVWGNIGKQIACFAHEYLDEKHSVPFCSIYHMLR